MYSLLKEMSMVIMKCVYKLFYNALKFIYYSTMPLNLNIQGNAKYISKILKSYKVYGSYNCRLKDLQG